MCNGRIPWLSVDNDKKIARRLKINYAYSPWLCQQADVSKCSCCCCELFGSWRAHQSLKRSLAPRFSHRRFKCVFAASLTVQGEGAHCEIYLAVPISWPLFLPVGLKQQCRHCFCCRSVTDQWRTREILSILIQIMSSDPASYCSFHLSAQQRIHGFTSYNNLNSFI